MKISKWMEKAELLGRQISDLKTEFLSPARAALKLQRTVNRCTIREWCDRGYVRHIRIRPTSTGVYRYLIPISEARRIELEMEKSRRHAESMLSTGEWLNAKLAAHALAIKPETVYHYCYRGKLKTIRFSTIGRRRMSLIPREEVETWLKKCKRKSKS